MNLIGTLLIWLCFALLALALAGLTAFGLVLLALGTWDRVERWRERRHQRRHTPTLIEQVEEWLKKEAQP